MASRWNMVVLCLLLGGIGLWASRPGSESLLGPAPKVVHSSSSPQPVGSQSDPPPERLGDGKLPNLVVVDVIYEDPYLKVVYANQGGAHVSADFVISLSSDGKTFAGNTNYRNLVPSPGQRVVSGGFTPGLVGLKPADIDPGPHGGFEEYWQELRVTIDPEDRVREMDESDNTLVCGVHIAADGSEGYVQKQEWHVLQSVDGGSRSSRTDHGPDLIVTYAMIAGGELTVTIANQGNEGSTEGFDANIFRGQEVLGKLNSLTVPYPGEQSTTSLPVPGLEPSDIVRIELDPANTVPEGREENNRYIRQLDIHQL